MIVLTRKKCLALSLLNTAILAGCASHSNTPMRYERDSVVTPQHVSENASSTASAMLEPLVKKIPVINPGYAKLAELNLNNGGDKITITPGATLQASLRYNLHSPDYQASSYQIIVGLARRSAQACIYQGGPQGEGVANFVLKAPAKPGKYDIRFRILQAADCAEALKEGWNADNSPSRETTIGTLLVSRKADKSPQL